MMKRFIAAALFVGASTAVAAQTIPADVARAYATWTDIVDAGNGYQYPVAVAVVRQGTRYSLISVSGTAGSAYFERDGVSVIAPWMSSYYDVIIGRTDCRIVETYIHEQERVRIHRTSCDTV